jgi:hypothetical protein
MGVSATAFMRQADSCAAETANVIELLQAALQADSRAQADAFAQARVLLAEAQERCSAVNFAEAMVAASAQLPRPEGLPEPSVDALMSPPQGCYYLFDATVRSGPSMGANLHGRLIFFETEPDVIAGSVIPLEGEDMTPLATMTGALQEGMITLNFTLPDGAMINGVGPMRGTVRDCETLIGTLTGPGDGDAGDWIGGSIADPITVLDPPGGIIGDPGAGSGGADTNPPPPEDIFTCESQATLCAISLEQGYCTQQFAGTEFFASCVQYYTNLCRVRNCGG